MHDARDVLGKLSIIRAVEIGFRLCAGSHWQLLLDVQVIEGTPWLGAGHETQLRMLMGQDYVVSAACVSKLEPQTASTYGMRH